MNIVVAGSINLGKSKIIGKLIADTNSFPLGELEQIKTMCVSNSKPSNMHFYLMRIKMNRVKELF